MTRKTYVCWTDVLNETDQIVEHMADLVRTGQEAIDHAHWVAERIRQLGRDMEAPSAPVIHKAKDGDTIEDGFGGCWSAWCSFCGKKSVEIVRPGKAQCPDCG